jgi:hypothetical protein
MYQDVLRSIEGVGLYPAISLVVFVAVFTLAVVHAARMDRDGARHMAALPIEEENP